MFDVEHCTRERVPCVTKLTDAAAGAWRNEAGGASGGDRPAEGTRPMSGSAIIELTIGLVLLYLVLALFCTVIQEWIAQIWSWRAKNLEAAIIHLLNDGRLSGRTDRVAASPEARKVLDHPLFKMLAPGTGAGITAADDRPSYVTSTNFTLALLDSLGTRGEGGLTPERLREKLRELATSNPALHRALQPILDAAEGRVREFIKGIEAWFDAAMDRASGWYKRNVKRWLLGLAALLALASNADTVQVALRLSTDSGLRAAVATYAATLAPADAAAEARLQELRAELARRLEARDLEGAFGGLPIGWGQCSTDEGGFSLSACYQASEGGLLNHPVAAVLAKVLGLLLTALAASLGAPFWFGLLQKLNAVRSTGPKPVSTTAAS
jgi:hypothetical protein